MAGIDKTYVTLEQYKIVRQWWIETKDKQLEDLGHAIWLAPLWIYTDRSDKYYIRSEDITDDQLKQALDFNTWKDNPNKQSILWNTSVKEDLWLALNCDIDFIQDRLKEQYNEWIGFSHKEKLDIQDRPFIAEVRLSDDNPIYFFKEYDDGTSEVIEDILFYGTTFLPKIFYQAIRTVCFKLQTTYIKYIIFNYYGVIVKYDQKDFFDVETGEKVPLAIDEKELYQPQLKHSYDVNDIIMYQDQEIFMSHENEAFDITQYKDSNRDNINRYINFLPEYISKLIKNM